MTSPSIVCTACGAEVAYGRLSCPECGELLASVAGSRRTAAPQQRIEAPIEAPVEAQVAGAVAATVAPPVLHDIDGLGALDGPDTLDDDDELGSFSAADDWRDATDEREDPVAAFSAALATAPPPASPVSTAPPPGAYVPPLPSLLATTSTAHPAPARAWAGANGGSNGSTNGSGSVTHDAEPAAKAATSIDPAKIEEFTGWLAVAGAALASVGFLLPWSNSVIGASGVGYFDRWGLAGPGHVVLVLALLVTFALALLKVPVPVWLRVGIPSLALGALLLGLVWPYLLGPLGAQPGVYAILVGALLLIVAGVTGIVGARHGGSARSV
jgi:predicted RNA-binding Zn-ribbon protein involved in translation (DUF1610 family)